jgi:HEAT repeat protein
VQTCPACKAELEQLRLLLGRVQERRPLEADEKLLQECRAELQDRLRLERVLGQRWKWVSPWYGWRPALLGATAVALLAIGFLAGRYLLPLRAQRPIAQPIAELGPSAIRSLSYDPETQQVEVRLGSTLLKGPASDPRIRAFLVHTLAEADNPGLRLRTVRALAAPPAVDEEVEAALIAAMEKDPNTGVRLQAIRVLKELPLTRPIKEALIRVLLTDRNPSMRKEAIDALSTRASDPEIAPTLRGLAQKDTSAYVRRKAGMALERRQQPATAR